MHITSPIPIVVLLQDLEFGGTQRYTIHLLKQIDRELFAPELWVLRGGLDMMPLAQEAGIKIIHLSSSSRVGPRALFHLGWRLLTNRPRVLYTLTVVPNIWGRVVGRMAGVPVIVSGYRSLFPKQHEKWLWPISDRIICNAHVLKEIMIRDFSVDPKRIAVVPNAVDLDYFQPGSRPSFSRPTVLSVGRLVEDKDPLTLLEGFRITAEHVPESDFEIMGNGPLRYELERRIVSYRLESRIRLLPGSDDVRPNMRRACVFALASAREAAPNVIIEAMAMGLPVVATRVGGIPELILDGKTGCLVPPGDPESLAAALIDLLTNESRRRTMGAVGRQRVATFHSLQYMIRETERALMEAIDQTPGQKIWNRKGWR